MILLVNVCAEKLHYFEFVKPIEDILKKDFVTRHYHDLSEKDLEKADKLIICGTSLKDNLFIEDIEKFSWVRDFDKPLLGICAGFQIIGLINGGKLQHHLEIGFFHEGFDKEFLGFPLKDGSGDFNNEVEVYHLHNNYVDFSKIKDFEVFSSSKISQAVKHRDKDIYGVLFHPEVRQKEMIRNFAQL